MRKINFQFLLKSAFISLGVFFLFFIFNTKVLAQRNPVVVETVGYSVVEGISFKLEGSYSGAIEGPGNEFTAYFEYKEEGLVSALDLSPNSYTVPDLDKDAHQVTKIVLQQAVNGVVPFYAVPNLLLNTTYYFRAAGYYNDNPSKKFYGETLNFYTGYGYGGGVDGEYGPGAGGGPYIILNPGTSPGGSSSSSGGCLPNQILANDGTCVSGEVSGRLGGGGLVPCGVYSSKGGEKIINWQCTFEDIFTLINNVIRFILFNMVVPIAAIMFAYAGFLLITAQGGEAKTKAKGIFTNAVIGLVIAVAAWLIVTTILWILGYKGTVFW